MRYIERYMLSPYNFYWFIKDNNHMTEPWLDQVRAVEFSRPIKHLTWLVEMLRDWEGRKMWTNFWIIFAENVETFNPLFYLFWNQIFICLSDKLSIVAISIRLKYVDYNRYLHHLYRIVLVVLNYFIDFKGGNERLYMKTLQIGK